MKVNWSASRTPGVWRQSGTKAKPHWCVAAPDVMVHGYGMKREDHVQQTLDRWCADAAFIARASTALPVLCKMVRAVLALAERHPPPGGDSFVWRNEIRAALSAALESEVTP